MSLPFGRSIRTKLILIISFVAAASVLVGILTMTTIWKKNLQKKTASELQFTSQLVAEYCVVPLTFGYVQEVQEILGKLGSMSGIVEAGIFDPEGKLIATYRMTDRQLPAPKRQFRTEFQDRLLTVYQPIEQDQHFFGTLCIRSSTVQLNQQLRQYYIWMGALFLGLTTLAVLAALWLQRIISQPILILAAFLREVGSSGHFQKRIHKQTEDEIGLLYEEVNDMLQAIHEGQEMRLAKETAEASARARSEFLVNMSHEIRTPMNAILGFTDLVMSTELSPRQTDYLRKVQSSAQALLGLLNDILDFSKIDAGKLDLENVEFSPAELLSTLSDLFCHRASEKGLELILSMAPMLPERWMGDPLRIRQILVNLVGNAIKFTEKGEVFIGLAATGPELKPEGLILTVSDTGIGIDESGIQRIFSPFVQADASTSRRFGGTGLGLTITKHLVELMGGRLEVESQLGRGTTFRCTLPLIALAPSSSHQESSSLVGMRVLVVDDNPSAREVLGAYLDSFGCVTSHAENGFQALDMLLGKGQQPPVDAVLLDWKMPGIDGIETARHIASNPELEGLLKIVMVTAYGGEEIRKQASLVGIQAFLLKPVTPGLLRETLMGVREAQQPEGKPSLIPSPESVKKLQGKQVLLVEDNPLNQQLAREILEGFGLRVTLAGNGQEALDALAKEVPHAVLMDIQMPGMDGYEATAHIRKNPSFQQLPIIAMTAHAIQGYREECLAAGMDDYLTKPINAKLLLETLQKWMRLPSYEHSEIPHQTRKTDLSLRTVNLSEAMERLGLSEDTCLRLLRKLAEDHASEASRIQEALKLGTPEEAQRLAHALKGSSSNLGVEEVFHAARDLEACLKAQEDPKVSLDRLQETLQAFVDEMMDKSGA